MTDDKPRRNRSPHNTTSRLNSDQLAFMEWLAPGFRAEYEATHDENGKVLSSADQIPGLRYIGDDRTKKGTE